eukprot:6362552-Pyramimonas_sp.AAC.1
MAAVQSGRLSSGIAAKMRGLATWMDAALAGPCLRAAGMISLQAPIYGGRSLRYIAAAAQCMLDRCIGPIAPPMRVYTYAAADADRVCLDVKVVIFGGRVL